MLTLSKEIIHLLNDHQEAAFEIVFKSYYPNLVYFAEEYIPYEDAKNIVQDAFISFWEKNPKVSNEFQLQSYLYTAVKNKCISYLRHEKIKKGYAEKAEISFQNQLYISALEKLDTTTINFQEIENIIENTLAELPARCREVFVLSRYHDKKNHEVAEELNISVKTVEANITKALKALKIALKDFLPFLIFYFSLRN